MRKSFGSYEIARFCEVAPATVGRWFKQGKLPFFLTGGGQRRVWAKDLAPFLERLKLPVPPLVSANGRLRVLIVDDDAIFRRALRRFFLETFPDFDVHEAADGFEGGLKVAQLVPAIVLLDLILPGQDGLKVCRLIRSNPNFKGVKIVCLSGHPSEDFGRQALEAGADEFVEKTLILDELAPLLKRFVA